MLLRRTPTLRRLPTRLATTTGLQRRLISGSPAGGSIAATAAADAVWTPITGVQNLLVGVQAATDAPWWVTIGGCALALRVAILPAVFIQVRETRRLLALRPQLLAVRDETAEIASPNARLWARVSKMYAVCRSKGVRPLRVVGLPLVQIPLLLTLVVSVRRMLLPDSPWADAMAHGGALWFRDLGAPDATAVVPVLSLLVLMANFQLASHGSRSGLLYGVRNVFQAGSVVALPFYAELSSGVFMYIIPNSAFSLLQTTLVRRFMPLPVAASARQVAATTRTPNAASDTSSSRVGRDDDATPALPEPAVGAAGPADVEVATANTVMSEAERECRGRIAVDALDVEAHVLLSKVLLRAKRVDEAVAHLWPLVKEQAIPRDASAPIRFQLGLALGLQEQHEVAEPLFEQVLQLEPGFVEAWLCLASTRAALGRVDTAVEALDKAAELRPEIGGFVTKEKERLLTPGGGDMR